MRLQILARVIVGQRRGLYGQPCCIPVLDLAGPEHVLVDEAIEALYLDDVFGRRSRKFDAAREHDQVVDRNIGHDILQCASAALVLNRRVEETLASRAVDVSPLRFVVLAEDDAVVVLGLDAQYAAGGQDGVVDLD